MKTTLIVARYKEQLDWLADIKNKNITAVIYDKAPAKDKIKSLDNLSVEYKIIPLQNSPGREAHTYFKYIIDNYEHINNDEYYVFTQGYPLDHINVFVKHLNDFEGSNDFLDFGAMQLTNMLYHDKIERRGVVITDFEFTMEQITILLNCFGFNCNFGKPLRVDISYFGIFGLPGKLLKLYTQEQYKEAFKFANEKWFGYAMEVLWRLLFVDYKRLR